MNPRYVLTLVCVTLLSAPACFAQAPGQPAGSQGGPDQGPQFRPFSRDGSRRQHGFGMGILPPGTWWKNSDVVTRLNLTIDQQKRMDDIFQQSRIQLVHMKASLEEEQINLEPLLNANPPDQARTFAEISRIADLRADLEKANAKMLLGLRGVLTADQWTKLQERRREDGPGSRFMNRQDGGGGAPRGQAGSGPGGDR